MRQSALNPAPAGIVWKTLPAPEREHWEAQAVKAQAEHRARYPHWRFRPASNQPKKPPAPRKKRNRTDGDGGGGNAKKRKSKAKVKDGEGDGVEREKEKEERCAKIARLLADGMKGDALETAVNAWDTVHAATASGDVNTTAVAPPLASANAADAPAKARSASPIDDGTTRFTVPLTAMFKRSASVPVPVPVAPLPSAKASAAWLQRRDSIGSAYSYEARASPALSGVSLESVYTPSLDYASVNVRSFCSVYRTTRADIGEQGVNPHGDFAAFSPPGSPFSVGTASDSDAASDLLAPSDALSTPGLAPPDFLSGFSTYSSLCDWAGADGRAFQDWSALAFGGTPFAGAGYAFPAKDDAGYVFPSGKDGIFGGIAAYDAPQGDALAQYEYAARPEMGHGAGGAWAYGGVRAGAYA
ncbi:hypothetical protein FA95DRAFT_227860 [Auriscalpium vulgare]|uniref:Uncharacterized protein n=1 Tax=Auriscalpium vulgare TaxID=40419 RepID=A0ACB8RM42_9AGAM|nr:hypothetical protein FA95DRAFT_227860 [Auriscalpium vulgare]